MPQKQVATVPFPRQSPKLSEVAPVAASHPPAAAKIVKFSRIFLYSVRGMWEPLQQRGPDARRVGEGSLMRDIRALIQAVHMHSTIGLVIATATVLLDRSPHADAVPSRSRVVLGDIVGWPRLLLTAGASMHRPVLRRHAPR